MGHNEFPLIILTGQDDTICAPIPFLERGAANTVTTLRTLPDVTSTTMVNTRPAATNRC